MPAREASPPPAPVPPVAAATFQLEPPRAPPSPLPLVAAEAPASPTPDPQRNATPGAALSLQPVSPVASTDALRLPVAPRSGPSAAPDLPRDDRLAPTAPLELGHIVARIDAGVAARSSVRGVSSADARAVPAPPGPPVVTTASPPANRAALPKMTAAPSNQHGGPALPFAPPAVPVLKVSTGTSYLPEHSPDKGATVPPGQFHPQPVTPFRGARPVVRAEDVDLSIFPLERYAEVVSALAAQEPRGDVLRRFVLNEEMWNALAGAWAARLATDPELQKAFSAMVRRERGGR